MTLHTRRRFAALAALTALGLAAPLAAARPASADTMAEAVRAVAEKNRGAAVTLIVVIKTSGGGMGGDNNTEVEVAGVMIDPSGLVVTTNTAIDPASTLASMGGDEGSGSKMTTRVVSARILTPDGEDIPAKVVLRDTDRNLAFLRPVSPPKSPLPFVDLKSAGTARIGDPLITLSRLGPVANRATQATILRVISVQERPRTLYLLETLALQGIGNIAFNEQGQPVGLLTVKVGAGGRRRTFSASDSVLPVVVPADDVQEGAEQAPAASAVKDGGAAGADPAASAPKKPAAAAPAKPNAPAKPAPKKPGAK